MQRNSYQMMEDIDLILDRTRSPRFSPTDKARALNMAKDKVVNDRYDNIKREKRYSFESYERIRSELSTIVVQKTTVSVVAGVVQYPTNFLYLLNLMPTIDSIQVVAYPINYDEELLINEDPFDKPTKEIPRYLESSAGIRIYHDGTTFVAAEMSYLKIPDVIFVGETDYDNSEVFTTGQVLRVSAGTVTYNSIVYAVDDTFTITTLLGLSFTGSGTCIKLTNCNLPGLLHDEITAIAASILSGNTEDYNKKKIIDIETDRS